MAEKTNQAYPLAPANGYTRSDGESLVSEDELKRQKRIKLFTYIGIFIVFQIIVMTVFGLTVMKVKTPKVRLGEISITNFNSAAATSSFDTTFNTQIRVKNNNWGPYKFDAGMVTFMYQGAPVGTVTVPKSKAGMRSTKKINVEVSLNTNALPSSSTLSSELNSGVLTLTSQAKLTGKVELMLIMKKKKSADMDCTIAFDLSTKTVKKMAEKTHQAYPLAPANGYTRGDGESLVSQDELKRRKRIRLFTYVGIFIVFQIIVMTVFGLTVMKVKTPKVRLGEINVLDFKSVPATPSFDTTFTTQIRVKNTNWGPYKFDASTVTFMYQGVAVGQVTVPKSKAGMRSTKKMNVDVSLNANGLPSSSNFGSELNSGVLTLNSQAKLVGKVDLMLIMKKKKSATMDCMIGFDLSTKTVKSLQCKKSNPQKKRDFSIRFY
ncbi:hypothetical protein ACLB2K_048534 [Fragaria x ananassa]